MQARLQSSWTPCVSQDAQALHCLSLLLQINSPSAPHQPLSLSFPGIMSIPTRSFLIHLFIRRDYYFHIGSTFTFVWRLRIHWHLTENYDLNPYLFAINKCSAPIHTHTHMLPKDWLLGITYVKWISSWAKSDSTMYMLIFIKLFCYLITAKIMTSH